MNDMPKFDRRSFLVGVASAGGGFSLGFNTFASEAMAADAVPEVNAWVVVKPDDSVVIRVVRPDMGQGSRTGLAQLVAEAVVRGDFEKGVLIDGFGGAVALAANKVPGARAVAAYDSVSARFAAAHDDANVLCLGGKTHGELVLNEILQVFFNTRFEGGRHEGRLAKIASIEKKYSK